MIILGLDQSASNTGWCLGKPEGPVQTGSFALGPYREDIGGLLLAFNEWLVDKIQGVHTVAFEKPIRPFEKLNLETARKLYGIAAHIEFVSAAHQKRCFEVDQQEAKQIAYNRGRITTKEKEAHAVDWIAEWGVDVSNHNEADAVAVWLVATMYCRPNDFPKWTAQRDAIRAKKGITLL